MTNSTTVSVIAGLSVGTAFIAIFSLIFANTSTNSIILPDSQDDIISLGSTVLGKVDSPDYTKEYFSKLSDGSILIDDNILNKAPILGQALAGADHRYEVYCPHDGCDKSNFMVISKSDLDSIVASLPSKEKISLKSEPEFNYVTSANATLTRISITLLYNNTYYSVGTAYFSSP